MFRSLKLCSFLHIIPDSRNDVGDLNSDKSLRGYDDLLFKGLISMRFSLCVEQFFLLNLGMLNITSAQQVTMLNAVNCAQMHIKKIINVLKYDRFLADAKWKVVEEMAMIDYPYKDLPEVSTLFEIFGWDKT